MSQLGAPQRSAQISGHAEILKIKTTVKILDDPRCKKGRCRGHRVLKTLGHVSRSESSAGLRGVWKGRAVTCDGIELELEERGILRLWRWLAENVKLDTSAQNRTQKAGVRDGTIRTRAGLQGNEERHLFRELCHPFESLSQIKPWRRSLLVFLCSKYIWITVSRPITQMYQAWRQDVSCLLLFLLLLSYFLQTEGLVRVTVFSPPAGLKENLSWVLARVRRAREENRPRVTHSI